MCLMQNSGKKYCTSLLALLAKNTEKSANDKLEIGIYCYSTYMHTRMQAV